MLPALSLERLYVDYPSFYTKELINRHVDRYKWAADYLKGGNIVLDAACGSGYGTKILSKNLSGNSYFVGLDNNKDAIMHACQHYACSNIAFRLMNLKDYYGSRSHNDCYDVVVSIETIEHFSKEDADKILGIFYRVLNKGGKLLITTPDAADSAGTNEFHVKEYTMSELWFLMSTYFKTTEIFRKDGSLFAIGWKE